MVDTRRLTKKFYECRITCGPAEEARSQKRAKMSVRLKFRGSITRIVSDIHLSRESNYSVDIRGLWDSGSMTCCIKKSISDNMNLPVIRQVEDVILVGRPASNRDVVNLDIQISDDITFHDLEAIVLPDDDMPSVGFIIGMNLINKGIMTIDGRIPGYTLFEFDRF